MGTPAPATRGPCSTRRARLSGLTAGPARAAARTRPRPDRREDPRAAPDPARRRARSPVAGPAPRTLRRLSERSGGPRSGASPSRRTPRAGPGRGGTTGSPPEPAPPRPSRGRCGGRGAAVGDLAAQRRRAVATTWASLENSESRSRARRSPHARRCRLLVRRIPEKICSTAAFPIRFRSRA